jgi:predicted nucleic acid-binding protein
VIEEEGSEQAATLWESADIVLTGRLTYPEARAALAAAGRAGRLSARGHRAAVGHLQRRWRQLHIVDLDQQLAESAGDLSEQHALRGYDAVHLGSALAVGRRETLVATWDAELASTARIAGLMIFPS